MVKLLATDLAQIRSIAEKKPRVTLTASHPGLCILVHAKALIPFRTVHDKSRDTTTAERNKTSWRGLLLATLHLSSLRGALALCSVVEMAPS